MNPSRTGRTPLPAIAVLYQRSVLDPIVEIARALAQDAVARARPGVTIDERLTTVLEGFRSGIGLSPEWPGAAQRSAMLTPIFHDAFRTTGIDLRAAAVAFVKTAVEASPHPLEDRVRDTALAFRGCLESVNAVAVSMAERGTAPIFQASVDILRERSLTAAFGSASKAGDGWPFDGASSPEASAAAALLGAIQQSLRLVSIQPPITQHMFLLLQRIAYYGAQTIAHVLDQDEPTWQSAGWAKTVAGHAYGWEQALQTALAYVADQSRQLAPRVVSTADLDDERLSSMPTDEVARMQGMAIARQSGGGGGGKHSCTYGWTIKCDKGPTCYTGFTLKCDTGPTCTTGFTLKCDSGPTCTYGWTAICDDPPLGRW